VRNTRWLIFAPLAVFALFPPAAKADLLGNWTYSQSQDCGGSIEVVDNIITLHGPDNQVQGFGLCGGQPHWVQIETTVPAGVNTVDFDWSYQTNDGWNYDPPQYGINGVYTLITQVNTSSGTLSVPVVEGDIFTFRQYSTDTCCKPGHLSIANLSLWEFTTTSTTQETTTSTIAPSTTVPVEEESTTTTLQTTTSLSPQTTEALEASTTTTIELPTPTTTLPPVSSETSDVPPVVDTIPPVVDTTVPKTTVPDTTVPDTTVPDTTVPDTLPPDTLPDAPETPETLPIDITEEIPAELTEALLDAIDSGEPLTEEQFDTAIEALGDLNEEEAVALIEQLLDTEVTADQAEELASNPDVLAVITEEQATEIFETIEVEQLDDTQIAELTAAIQDAPLAVQEAFESTIDIFGGFDDYVPTGSNIPVGERRTLIAIAAGATLTAASTRMRR
jgi:hypothetical protein